jgi:hypothetical protein
MENTNIMSQTKVFSFDYSAKVVVDGKEEKQKKQGECTAVQFDNVSDALAYFEGQEAGKGESLLVAELNASLKNTAIANMRASLTRTPVLPKSIREKAGEKLDAAEKATFNALMLKLGLAQLPS